MKLALTVAGVVLGLIAGGGAGSYWYLANATTAPVEEVHAEPSAFVNLERKFVVPLVRGNRVHSLVVADLRLQVRSGSLDEAAGTEPGILLGVELARVLGVLPGDAVTVISPKGAMTAVGLVPKMRRYPVVGTIEVGMHEYDASLAYLALPAAQEFAGLDGVTGIVAPRQPNPADPITRLRLEPRRDPDVDRDYTDAAETPIAIIGRARAINPGIEVIARAHGDDERRYLEEHGAQLALVGEHELAFSLAHHALQKLGCDDDAADETIDAVRRRPAPGA